MYIVIHDMQLDYSLNINAKKEKINNNSSTIQSLIWISYLENETNNKFPFPGFLISTH